MIIPNWLQSRNFKQSDCPQLIAFSGFSNAVDFSVFNLDILKKYGQYLGDLKEFYRFLRVLGLYGVQFTGKAESYSRTLFSSPILISANNVLDAKLINIPLDGQLTAFLLSLSFYLTHQLHGIRLDTLSIESGIPIEQLESSFQKIGFEIVRDEYEILKFYAPITKDNTPINEDKPQYVVHSTEVIESNFNFSLEDLELSVRAYNVLNSNGIDSVEKLLSLSETDLLNFSGCGSLTITDIVNSLSKVNLRLGMLKPVGVNISSKNEMRSKPRNINLSVDELNLSVRAYNVLMSNKITNVQQLIVLTESQLLNFNSCGKNTVREIVHCLNELNLELGMDLSNSDIFGDVTLHPLEFLVTLEDFNLTAHMKKALENANIHSIEQLLILTQQQINQSKYLSFFESQIKLLMDILDVNFYSDRKLSQIFQTQNFIRSLIRLPVYSLVYVFSPKLSAENKQILIQQIENNISMYSSKVTLQKLISLTKKQNQEPDNILRWQETTGISANTSEKNNNKYHELDTLLLNQFLPKLKSMYKLFKHSYNFDLIFFEEAIKNQYVTNLFIEQLDLTIDMNNSILYFFRADEINDFLDEIFHSFIKENQINVDSKFELSFIFENVFRKYTSKIKIPEELNEKLFQLFLEDHFVVENQEYKLNTNWQHKCFPLTILSKLPELFDKAISIFPENHQKVLIYRSQGLTLDQIGKTQNVTRERIRQIEKNCQRKLKLSAIGQCYKSIVISLEKQLKSCGGLIPVELGYEKLLKISELFFYLADNANDVNVIFDCDTQLIVDALFMNNLKESLKQEQYSNRLFQPNEFRQILFQIYSDFWVGSSDFDISEVFETSFKYLLRYLEKENIVTIENEQFFIASKSGSGGIVVELFKELYPHGAHIHKASDEIFETICKKMPALSTKNKRYVTSQVAFFPNKLLLWDTGFYIHIDNTNVDWSAIDFAIDECLALFSENIDEFKVNRLFELSGDKYISAGIPTPHALYSLLRIKQDERLSFPKYPRIKNPLSNSQTKSIVEVLEEYALSNQGIVSKDDLKKQFCELRGWKQYELDQTINRSKNIFALDFGSIIHKDSLNIDHESFKQLILKIDAELETNQGQAIHLAKIKDKYGAIWVQSIQPLASPIAMGHILSKTPGLKFNVSRNRYVQIGIENVTLSNLISQWMIQYNDFVTREQIFNEFCKNRGWPENSVAQTLAPLPKISYGKDQFIHPVVIGLETGELQNEIGNKLQEDLGTLFEAAAQISYKEGSPHTQFEWIIDEWWDKKPKGLDEKWWNVDFLAGVADYFSDIEFMLVFHQAYVLCDNKFDVLDLDDLIAFLMAKEFNHYRESISNVKKLLRREAIIYDGIPKSEVFFEGSSIELVDDETIIQLSKIGRDRFWKFEL